MIVGRDGCSGRTMDGMTTSPSVTGRSAGSATTTRRGLAHGPSFWAIGLVFATAMAFSTVRPRCTPPTGPATASPPS